MADQLVVPFNSAESDMAVWEPISPDYITSGNPVQRGNEYFRTRENVLHAGIWDCTAFESVVEPYEVDEFMILLEGEVIIVDENGDEKNFKAGESFFIPKGFNCSWKQPGYVKKFYMIFENGVPAEKNLVATSDRVDTDCVLDPMQGLNADDFIGQLPAMSIKNIFQDKTQQFNIGVWESTAMTRVPGTINRSELMHILEGSGEVVNGDGVRFKFSKGDTFLVPVGMGYQWISHVPVKKVFCSFQPI